MIKPADRGITEEISARGGGGESLPVSTILVLGLGNELLKDDAVGIRVAEKLQGEFRGGVEVRTTSLFGLSLLDELAGREKVLLVDSYLPDDLAPAEIREFDLDSVGNVQAPCPHFVGLAEIREITHALGFGFPREVRVLGIPVSDPLTFSTEMSPEVAARVEEAAGRARGIVQCWLSSGKQSSPSQTVRSLC